MNRGEGKAELSNLCPKQEWEEQPGVHTESAPQLHQTYPAPALALLCVHGSWPSGIYAPRDNLGTHRVTCSHIHCVCQQTHRKCLALTGRNIPKYKNNWMLLHPFKDPSRDKIARKPKHWMWSATLFHVFNWTAHEGHNPAVQDTQLSVLLGISKASDGIVSPALTRLVRGTAFSSLSAGQQLYSEATCTSLGYWKPWAQVLQAQKSFQVPEESSGSRKNSPRVAILGALFCMFSDVQRWGIKELMDKIWKLFPNFQEGHYVKQPPPPPAGIETFSLEKSYLLHPLIKWRLCVIYIEHAKHLKRVRERHGYSPASIFESISIFPLVFVSRIYSRFLNCHFPWSAWSVFQRQQ